MQTGRKKAADKSRSKLITEITERGFLQAHSAASIRFLERDPAPVALRLWNLLSLMQVHINFQSK